MRTAASNWSDVLRDVAEGRYFYNADSEKPRPKKLKRYYLRGQYDGLYLTERQRQILILFLYGESCSSISKSEGISVRTVEEYCKQLREKLQFATKREMVKCFLQSRFLNTLETITPRYV